MRCDASGCDGLQTIILLYLRIAVPPPRFTCLFYIYLGEEIERFSELDDQRNSWSRNNVVGMPHASQWVGGKVGGRGCLNS
jgi:hypothetical protein